jgi:hypothetical protein
LSVEAARNLVKTIEAVLAQAEQRGVLEDIPQGQPAKPNGIRAIRFLNWLHPPRSSASSFSQRRRPIFNIANSIRSIE